MDQAKLYIVVAVIVSMMFALAILQKISRSSGDSDGPDTSGTEVVAVRSSTSLSDAKEYTSLVNQNIPLASPNLACLETPNEREQVQKANEFAEQTKAVTTMLVYDKKLWSNNPATKKENEQKK